MMAFGRLRTRRLAFVLSVVGSPFALLPLTVLLVSLRTASPGRALVFAAALACLGIVPLILLLRHKVRTGRWSDHDVSDRSHRREFYPIAMLITAGTAVGMWFLGAPRIVVRGILVLLLLLVLAAIVSRWSKISLHTSVGAFCTVSLVSVNLWVAGGALILATAVGWARISLERHTLWQVLNGAALGAAAGLAVLRPALF
jgi:membrane-associated phospholipid phosphatase